MHKLKKIKVLLISLLAVGLINTGVFASTDDFALTDPVVSIYKSTEDGEMKISNLDFTDVLSVSGFQDAVYRAGALDMISGGARLFRPSDTITAEEALKIIISAIGKQGEAQQIAADMVEQGDVFTHWSMGYMQLAADLKLITDEQLDDALADQNTLGATSFYRNFPATREQIAQWVNVALRTLNNPKLLIPTSYNKIYEFTDWQQISIDKLDDMETMAVNGIYKGYDNKLNPKRFMTRAEMAQMMKNLDDFYYSSINYQKKTGTVAAIVNTQQTQTGDATGVRQLYIRLGNGQLDMLEYETRANTDPTPKKTNTVVLYDGKLKGMDSLREGDQIEYIVNNSLGTLLYIQKIGDLDVTKVSAYLLGVDTATKQVTVQDQRSDGKMYTYSMVDGMLTEVDSKYILRLRTGEINVNDLHSGSLYELTLTNNIVTAMLYKGEEQQYKQVYGVVVDNSADLGYITIVDTNGNEASYSYYNDDLVVKKEQYYDKQGGNSYVSQVFPNFMFDPSDAPISDIEAGDIVYLTVDDSDSNAITYVSAVTNYSMKYGNVKQISTDGSTVNILLQYENGESELLEAVYNIFVSQNGRTRTIESIMPGDWVQLLVNEAILAPGETIVTIKEIKVEGATRKIENILKGELAGIDKIQNKLLVQNCQTLQKTGWENYTELKRLDLGGSETEYYYNGKQISASYALQFLKDSQLYIATEKNFDSEKVKKVTFFNDREELLGYDTIASADGNGAFSMLAGVDEILADPSTIVRRHGRLVDAQNILPLDYANVIVSGQKNAAIVDIVEEPNNDFIEVFRVRIASVDDGRGFQAQSIAIFSNISWSYTPIEKVFTIDYNTEFYDATGLISRDTFVSYGQDSAVDQVYTVVASGTKALKVYSTPYVVNAIRGTVIQNEGSSITLKNCFYYDESTNKWIDIGIRNTLKIATQPNGMIFANSETVTADKIVNGDQLRIMVDALPARYTDGLTLNGFMIFVEK